MRITRLLAVVPRRTGFAALCGAGDIADPVRRRSGPDGVPSGARWPGQLAMPRLRNRKVTSANVLTTLSCFCGELRKISVRTP